MPEFVCSSMDVRIRTVPDFPKILLDPVPVMKGIVFSRKKVFPVWIHASDCSIILPHQAAHRIVEHDVMLVVSFGIPYISGRAPVDSLANPVYLCFEVCNVVIAVAIILEIVQQFRIKINPNVWIF